jgi:hypothetical protein
MAKYHLGKKLSETIRKTLDENKINRLRRQVEDIKLQIIDAIELNKLPPVFEDVKWLYDLCYGDEGRSYRFIWSEFNEWLSFNGLSYDFKSEFIKTFGGDEYGNFGYHKKNLKIEPSTYTDFDSVEEIDTTSWLTRLKESASGKANR